MIRRPLLLELSLFALAALAALYGFGSILGRPGGRPVPRRPGTLRVMTWNLGTPDGPLTNDPDSASLDRLRRTLVEIDADVMVLQEVEAGAASFLAAAFSGSRFLRAEPGSVRAGCTILVQRGRLQGGSEDGGARSLRVTYRPTRGPAIEVLGLHADAWSSQERNRQIGRAVGRLAASEGSALRVLAGDLNLDVDLGGGKDLFTEDEYLDVQTYNYLAERMHDAGAGTGPTAEPDRRLDYVFLQGPSLDVATVTAAVWRGRRVSAMDHDPLVVDLPRP